MEHETGREPTDAETRNCHDCGVMPGQYHMEGCDVERCPECGGQLISCDCDLPGPHRALPWTGIFPGHAEAREFGWFSRFVDGHGWVRCGKDEAGASPDLNRLVSEAVWDADRGRFVLSGARPMPDTKLCGAVTQAGEDRKFRTCEKPAGHDGMHETTICGQGWSWMPDTPAPDEERRTVCVYDKYDPDYVYRPDDGGEYRMQFDRRSGTKPEPTDAEYELVLELYRAARRLAGAKTLSDVQAVIDAVNEVPWSTIKRLSGARPMPDTPAPVPGNECEHAQLARDVFEEAVRLQARIAELEAENTALVAKLNTIRIWSITEDDRIGMFAKGYASARRWVAMYF